MAVPSFLLKKLYIKGSLKNTAQGFELALKNNLAPGSLIGLGPLKIDETEYPPSAVTMVTPQGEFKGDQVSSKSPLTFAMNTEVKIRVQGEPISEGTHHIVFSVLTREVGRIEFDLTDNLTP